MNTFRIVVYILTTVAIVTSIIEVYLRINKIWKRKHEPEVARSQSVIGLLLAFATILVWIVYYSVKKEIAGVFDNIIYLFEISIFILIGSGLWLRGKEKTSLFQLIKLSLKLEKKEADYLLKKFFKPENPELIIEILHRLALIDRELNIKEEEIISAFANDWNIQYSPKKYIWSEQYSLDSDFSALRATVVDYLDRNPDYEQAAQLKDMMSAIVKADEKITAEEDLILSELLGLIENYLSEDSKSAEHCILIIPQKPQDYELISNLMPDADLVETSGGVAYCAGTYYSRKYADMLCCRFREQNLFTIVISDKERNT